MKNHNKLSGLFLIIMSLVLGFNSLVFGTELDLVGLLTENLGINSQQAKGGAGAIFNFTSEQMNAEDFANVKDSIPEIQSLMSSASEVAGSSKALGGLSSMFNKSGSSMESISKLAETFSKLDLSNDMVGQFIPIILDYAKSKGGEGIASLLEAALQNVNF